MSKNISTGSYAYLADGYSPGKKEKPPCDHMIGVCEIYLSQGYTLIKKSDNFKYNLPMYEFDYCPKCGTNLKG